ncbi:MAG: ATP-binding cassette domain-containing protein [Oscillospiraceae bacterium]|nr:ATP-binding cassette domain-containing protein [Oscillospiraceae bacterium]
MGAFLRVENLTKNYGSFTALRDITLDVQEGEFVCLLGPSGCGKTTLLRVIAGLETADAGKVYLRGEDATHLPPPKRNFGIVFQSYALFPNMTVWDNVAFGLKAGKGAQKISRDGIQTAVQEALRLVHMEEQAEKYPAQLSGGQQQRAALARALAIKPSFLLLDEPLSALDAKIRQKVRLEIKSLQQSLGITTVMVTHDQEEALTMADQLVVMNNACIRQTGSPREVYNHPNSPFVADFVGQVNFFQNIPIENQSAELRQKLAGSHYKLKAIRPEHIHIAKTQDEGIPVTVVGIEFLGSGYRIALTGDVSGVHNETFFMDLTDSRFRQAELSVGDSIRVRFDAENVFSYRLDADPQFVKAA